MPKSNGRPKSRQSKKKPSTKPACQRCTLRPATKYGLCVRCMDDPLTHILLQSHGVYLPTRTERRTY